MDLESPGVEVRPLVQLTGEAEFNEVFLDEVFVPSDQLVGGLHDGWLVASTTLTHERGTIFAFKEQVVHEVYLDELYGLARATGALDHVEHADALAQSFVDLRVLRLHNWRTLSRLSRGIEPGPETSWVKLAWTDMTQRLSGVAVDLCGDAAPLGAAPRRARRRQVAAAVALERCGVDRRRHLRDPEEHRGRADPRPAPLVVVVRARCSTTWS